MKSEKHASPRGERVFLIALGLFSLLCLAASLTLFLPAPQLSGEGTVPLLCSVVMVVMCGVLLAESRGRSAQPAPDGRWRETVRFLFPGKVGPILLYCLVYVVLLEPLGFFPATFLFLAVSMFTLDRARKVRMLVIAGLSALCILVLFQHIFLVQLP